MWLITRLVHISHYSQTGKIDIPLRVVERNFQNNVEGKSDYSIFIAHIISLDLNYNWICFINDKIPKFPKWNYWTKIVFTPLSSNLLITPILTKIFSILRLAKLWIYIDSISETNQIKELSALTKISCM